MSGPATAQSAAAVSCPGVMMIVSMFSSPDRVLVIVRECGCVAGLRLPGSPLQSLSSLDLNRPVDGGGFVRDAPLDLVALAYLALFLVRACPAPGTQAVPPVATFGERVQG